MIGAGLLHENELVIIEDLERKFPGYGTSFLPLVWAASIVTKARKEGRIYDDFAVKTIIEALNDFRGACGDLIAHHMVSIPLVYTQVVTIATYTYFAVDLMAHQPFHSAEESAINLWWDVWGFIPVLTVLQIVFYMGCLKVAETLINPFGEDDDDFEVIYMIDINLQTSYLIVDEMHKDHPELLKDQYWNSMSQTLPDIGKIPQNGKENETFPNEQDTNIEMDPSDSNKLSKRPTTSDENLIPQNVVTGKLRNNAEVMKEKALIEMQMEEAKKKLVKKKNKFYPSEPTTKNKNR